MLKPCGAQVASKTSSVEVSTPPQYQQIRLALDVHAASIVAVRQLTRELEAQAPKVLPKGMGRLTYEAVETEVAAWDRFQNRHQVGSYDGLSGGVSASGRS